MVEYTLQKIKFPFEGSKWVISNPGSSPFGMYSTKAAAKKDIKEYGLKVVEK